MSEFDDTGNAGRKGFVRDVMRRISASGPRPDDDPEREAGAQPSDPVGELQDALRFFGAESTEFRRRLERLLAEYETARRRYLLMRQQVGDAERQNEKLVHTLQEAKQQIELLKEEVDKLCAPPNGYGVFTRANKPLPPSTRMLPATTAARERACPSLE
jgi:DNA repair exonuclease SbcCD ATPase subunit